MCGKFFMPLRRHFPPLQRRKYYVQTVRKNKSPLRGRRHGGPGRHPGDAAPIPAAGRRLHHHRHPAPRVFRRALRSRLGLSGRIRLRRLRLHRGPGDRHRLDQPCLRLLCRLRPAGPGGGAVQGPPVERLLGDRRGGRADVPVQLPGGSVRLGEEHAGGVSGADHDHPLVLLLPVQHLLGRAGHRAHPAHFHHFLPAQAHAPAPGAPGSGRVRRQNGGAGLLAGAPFSFLSAALRAATAPVPAAGTPSASTRAAPRPPAS